MGTDNHKRTSMFAAPRPHSDGPVSVAIFIDRAIALPSERWRSQHACSVLADGYYGLFWPDASLIVGYIGHGDCTMPYDASLEVLRYFLCSGLRAPS
jgi:hypothetical protein